MRTSLFLVCFSFLLAGCMHLRVSQRPLGQIMASYRSVTTGMTKQEVIARLGAPDNVERNGVLHWEEGSSAERYADLRVKLDADGRVLRTTVWSTNSGPYPQIDDRLVNPQVLPPDPRNFTLPDRFPDRL